MEEPYIPFYKPYGMTDEEYSYEVKLAEQKHDEWEQYQKTIMEKRELIERVAAGLRKMDIKPDYLLYVDYKTDFTWDEETICGIPVLHTTIVVNSGYDGDDFFFHPVFKHETAKMDMQIYYFQRGFKEMA